MRSGTELSQFLKIFLSTFVTGFTKLEHPGEDRSAATMAILLEMVCHFIDSTRRFGPKMHHRKKSFTPESTTPL